ncbi:hypothetical protein DEJ23_06085 [Curtobacterium sp. MCSS17_008]|uniref:hypothetical protein n=1 Tax=Curtobacterium sp. MCSS17_008 TaxID=2175647 RepID=UPI000DA8BD8B|nr:hypothetical protein [Curtobacterium sp. MCSS17_008]PZF57709.1 hypothetical protein DEJ23_06085 [Curtobacterium sp. MCSS17_008]
MTTTSRSTTFRTAAFLAVALPFGLAACSSDDTTSTSTEAAADGVGAKWSACMRDGGFDVADVSDDEVRSGVQVVPPGVDRDAWSTRAGDCSRQLGIQGSSDAQHQKWERQYAAVASCIRENGYPDFPEQEPGGISTGDYARATEPEFEEVFQECLHEYAPDTQTKQL